MSPLAQQNEPRTATNRRSPAGATTAAVSALILSVLSAIVLREEIARIVHRALADSEASHALAAPVLMALLWWSRRDLIRKSLRPGSLWGVVLIAVAIGMYGLSIWPFNYGYPRQMAIVPAVAGCILAACGWRVLKNTLPLLLILLLAVPLGYRHYAFLIVLPETLTLAVAEPLFNMLPGVLVTLESQDIFYSGRMGSGTIALGDPNRGASLFLAFLMIGAFVTFVVQRPWWQIMGMAVLAGPIVLVSNLLRLLLHGSITMYGDFSPLSSVPRTLSTALALLAAWAMFSLVLLIMRKVVVETEVEGQSSEVRNQSLATDN